MSRIRGRLPPSGKNEEMLEVRVDDDFIEELKKKRLLDNCLSAFVTSVYIYIYFFFFICVCMCLCVCLLPWYCIVTVAEVLV